MKNVHSLQSPIMKVQLKVFILNKVLWKGVHPLKFFTVSYDLAFLFNRELDFQRGGIQRKVTTRLVHPCFTGGEQCSCCCGQPHHPQSSAAALLCRLQRHAGGRRVCCHTSGFQQLEH